VISEARSHKIRLILSLCNNWEDYGGKAQYVRWGKEAGLDLTSDDDFFSDPTIKSYYKAFVKVNFFFGLRGSKWRRVFHYIHAVKIQILDKS
jgi:endo-1,4-beta-mannosidase